jgi:hypothetical protein
MAYLVRLGFGSCGLFRYNEVRHGMLGSHGVAGMRYVTLGLGFVR